MTRKEKKDLAREYYIQGKLTQKAIAKKVGVTEKTLSKWVKDKDYEWKKLKDAIEQTFDFELVRLQKQLKEFNDHIETKDEGKRFGSASEYDALAKLRNTIKYFQSQPIGGTISALQDFLNYYKKVDLEKAKELSIIVDSFIRSKL